MSQGAGGNVKGEIGTDSYIQVDGQFAPMHDKLKAAVEKLTPLPIKYLINTHYHGDHTGGNAAFHKDGATIVAQDNIRVRLAAGTTNALNGNKAQPQPADALPTATYYGGPNTSALSGRTRSIGTQGGHRRTKSPSCRDVAGHRRQMGRNRAAVPELGPHGVQFLKPLLVHARAGPPAAAGAPAGPLGGPVRSIGLMPKNL